MPYGLRLEVELTPHHYWALRALEADGRQGETNAIVVENVVVMARSDEMLTTIVDLLTEESVTPREAEHRLRGEIRRAISEGRMQLPSDRRVGHVLAEGDDDVDLSGVIPRSPDVGGMQPGEGA